MNKLTNEQKKLITDNIGLLRNFIKETLRSQVIPRHLEDDFISEMNLKFCFSARKYNADTGFKFSTYAYRGFAFGIRDVITRKNKAFNEANYVEKVDSYYTDIDESDFDKRKSLQAEEVDNLVDGTELTSKERSMIEDYYYNKITFEKIGVKYNLSREGVRQIIKRALKKVRKKAENQKMEIEDFYA